MPGAIMDFELHVEPQSLKKLSFKSMKRALDLFSPVHGQFPSPDFESKKIRVAHKVSPDLYFCGNSVEEGVVATAGDNGSLWFWDWKSGHNFQQAQTIVQPGSLDSEAGIYAISYDVTESRLITCEADKTIKIWKEDDKATPETHPLNFKPPRDMRRF